MKTNYPASYHHTQVFRFKHVKPGSVFEVTKAAATEDVPAGHYVRASVRKALPCQYDQWAGVPHVTAENGVRYVPANLPVVQTWV